MTKRLNCLLQKVKELSKDVNICDKWPENALIGKIDQKNIYAPIEAVIMSVFDLLTE